MPVERTVHVVDDDEAVRRSLKRLLDAAGVHVISYETSLAFLDAAPNLAPGCALLDIKMPGMDGLQLQALLLQRNIPLPVIMMTGQGDVESAVHAMKAGAVDFIEKPYSDDVCSRHRSGVGQSRSRWIIGLETAAAAETDRNALTARARGARRLSDRPPEQGYRLRSRHQRSHGRGPSRADDGTPWRTSVCRGNTPRGFGA